MLRLALAATLMYSATALTYNGDVITIYGNYDSSIDASAAVCDTSASGTTAGPVWAHTNGNGFRPIVLGECYGTDGASSGSDASVIPMNSQFAAEAADQSGWIFTDVTEVMWNVATADVKMTGYTGAANDCASTAVGTDGSDAAGETAGDGNTGWQCRDQDTAGATQNSFSMGIADGAANAASARVQGVNYVTVTYTDDNGTSGTVDCDRTSGSTTIQTVAGQIIDYWPVCANESACQVGSCSTATGTTHTANEEACLAVTSAVWTAGTGSYTKAHWALCYGTGTAGTAGSWQVQCDQETGNLVRIIDTDDTFCVWNVAQANAGNQTVTQMTKSSGGSLGGAAADTSWCVSNSATEWDAICSIPAHTATAKYFKGYFLATQGDCATQTAATSATAAENDGTKDVFLGVCYTLEVDGEMPGWQGPFITGGTGSEPIASKRSYKFVEGTTDILLNAYTTHDCSGGEFAPSPSPANGGSMTQYTDDDPAGTALAWACQNSSVISHGAVAAGGNIAVLQTATNYLSVRRHPGTAANAVGLPGVCTGVNATTGVAESLTTGLILDYFRVGSTAADGCHQMDDGASNATTASGYSWWCDSSDYSINYGTFGTADCSASQLAGALKFSKLSYTACTEADAADSTTTCTANGPSTSVENPSAFVYATVTTAANGLTASFGGKCLVSASNVSWEILSDSATWDAMCSAPTPAPTTATSTTSGAGKIAATAAAAAAAAALLL